VNKLNYTYHQQINDFLFEIEGTTVLGAFDPIEEIADVCAEYGLWFHVDAAWGGGALMSPTHRKLMQGIERSGGNQLYRSMS